MKYFISYEISDRKGWYVIDRDKPICTEEDLYEIMVEIQDYFRYIDDIVILEWQKMELPE